MIYFRSPMLIPALAAFLAGCEPAAPTPLSKAPPFTGPGWFTEVTGEVGLHFLHDSGSLGSYFFPQEHGSGAALFDFDGDGRLDLLLLTNAGPDSTSKNALYRQLPDGRFQDASAGSGLDFAGFNMGVAVGDVNNDGLPDVLITQYGGVKLFLNKGDGTFKDVTHEAGLDQVDGWCTSAAFFDYDRDGFLDLVVTRYVDYNPRKRCPNTDHKFDYCHPLMFHGATTKLFHNLGARAEGVRFEDVTTTSGIGRSLCRGLGVLCADFDGDGWPDVLVANDAGPNRLWMNQRNGTFTEEAVSRGVAFTARGEAWSNMGIAWGDVDGDLLPDLFVTHLSSETNVLWKQRPLGRFHDATQASRLDQSLWHAVAFGAVMGDFDNQGALDIAIVNGSVSRNSVTADNPELDPFWAQYAGLNQLFANDGSGHFHDVSLANEPFCKTPRVSRGLAVGDVFNDGSQDLLVTEIDGPARLFRNVAADRGHWLVVRAVDPALRRDAYGAQIVVRSGGKSWVRWINPGGSYLCSSDPRAHFGLGKADHVDAVEIVWPDGRKETFDGGPADRQLDLRQGAGRAAVNGS